MLRNLRAELTTVYRMLADHINEHAVRRPDLQDQMIALGETIGAMQLYQSALRRISLEQAEES